MVCKKCGQDFEESFNNCPNCGESVNGKKKAKKPIFKKWWFWLIIVIFIVGFISSSGGSDNSDTTLTTAETTNEVTQVQNTNETTSNEANTEDFITSEATTEEVDYREACISVSYKDIARMPDDYKGMDVYFSGQVIQVMESSFLNSVTYRINVTQDEYGYWEDTVYVTYDLPDGSPRILEDDIVTFYGVCKGTYTYASVLGSNITIPYVDAKNIDIIS